MYSGTGLSEIRTASIQQTNHVPPIDFAIEIIHFQPPRDRPPPISGQLTMRAPKGQVAVRNGLQQRTKIELSDENC